jgi:hypothetical protein
MCIDVVTYAWGRVCSWVYSIHNLCKSLHGQLRSAQPASEAKASPRPNLGLRGSLPSSNALPIGPGMSHEVSLDASELLSGVFVVGRL